LAFSAFIMLSQKISPLALTVSPLLHFQPFMVTVTVWPPSVYTGSSAGESG